MNLNKIVLEFNNGNWDDYEMYFNDIDTFLNILNKYNILNELDLDQINYNYNYEISNEVLKFLYTVSPEYTFNKMILKTLHDVVEQDGKYFLINHDLEDLFENLFTKSESHLSYIVTDDRFERIFDYISEPPDKIVESLNSENIDKLSDLIQDLLSKTPIDAGTELLEYVKNSIEGIDTNEEYFIIQDKDIIKEIIDDSESLNYIMNEYFTDLRDSLDNLYDSCYNDTYINQLYDNFVSEISEYFNYKTIKYTKENKIIIEIEDIFRIIDDYLRSDYVGEYLLDWGSFLGILSELVYSGEYDSLSINPPYYPDFRRIDNCLNESLFDYI